MTPLQKQKKKMYGTKETKKQITFSSCQPCGTSKTPNLASWEHSELKTEIIFYNRVSKIMTRHDPFWFYALLCLSTMGNLWINIFCIYCNSLYLYSMSSSFLSPSNCSKSNKQYLCLVSYPASNTKTIMHTFSYKLYTV